MSSNVIDMQAFRDNKPEHRRRHGDPLFAEGVHTRVPIVSRAVLLALPAIKSDDPHAARDAERSFEQPRQYAAAPSVQPAAPAVAPPVIPVERAAGADTAAQVFSLEAARRLVAESHGDHAEQTSLRNQQQASEEVSYLAQQRETIASQQADAELQTWFEQSGWKQDANPGAIQADEVNRYAA